MKFSWRSGSGPAARCTCYINPSPSLLSRIVAALDEGLTSPAGTGEI